MWVWAWNQKPWCTEVQRHMYHGENAEIKSQHLSPTIPSVMGDQLQMTCEKIGHLFISQHSFI